MKDKASIEIESLAKKYQPDALCLQEVNVSRLPKTVENLELAVGTSKNRLGLAIYVDTEKYSIEAVNSFKLRDAAYDRIAAPAHERLLGVHAKRHDTGQSISIGSFHASPLTALNSIRRDQIHNGLLRLEELGQNSPLIMLGDFNYPVFRRRLEREMASSGYQLYTSNQVTYRNKAIRGHFDFAAAKDFSLKWMRTLRQGVSDHLPILVRTSLV